MFRKKIELTFYFPNRESALKLYDEAIKLGIPSTFSSSYDSEISDIKTRYKSFCTVTVVEHSKTEKRLIASAYALEGKLII